MIAAKVFTASSPALKALRAQSTFNAVRISSVGLGRSYASQRTFGPSLQQTFQQRRNFTPSSRGLSKTEKDVFLAPADKDTPQIAKTETSWPHPIFEEQRMIDIEVSHRPTLNMSDRFALGAVRFLRSCMDFATGYKHDPNTKQSTMTEKKWLIRFIFLESVAGVPGMVGGMLRHLHSLRRMKRDNGWIESLIEEAFNERMHLLTFLKLQTPGLFMRTMILGAQGVFFNGFFLSYLVSPKTCHRFVGYLEEEAVLTYTCALADLEAGRLPGWAKLEAPEIAIEYWNMPEGKRTMRDLLLYVRADEAKHREVNHTLGNLHQTTDPNPFVSQYADPTKPHPEKGLKFQKPVGWTREEAL